MYRVQLEGKTCITARILIVLPNLFGGINTVALEGVVNIWTGFTHLESVDRVTIPVNHIESVQWRCNLNESKEKWQTIFKCKKLPKSEEYYAFWREVAWKLMIFKPNSKAVFKYGGIPWSDTAR